MVPDLAKPTIIPDPGRNRAPVRTNWPEEWRPSLLTFDAGRSVECQRPGVRRIVADSAGRSRCGPPGASARLGRSLRSGASAAAPPDQPTTTAGRPGRPRPARGLTRLSGRADPSKSYAVDGFCPLGGLTLSHPATRHLAQNVQRASGQPGRKPQPRNSYQGHRSAETNAERQHGATHAQLKYL